ncbi:hypothetical protein U0033_16900 [Chitinophaga sancti]|uniref:Uncharacterized protein n=1 Tax=Chitinophaga sancti TaxID=1004 RepID=A0ABZ0XCH6_9BACT|nr:hypothetical protein [Chitinophaga sancti]WQD59574.1 hypothetical protein U0033_16900 [Chitinophaga sancti]WQG88292.1 hypothetical protein SR876_25565 [Chitinophaga sancti]
MNITLPAPLLQLITYKPRAIINSYLLWFATHFNYPLKHSYHPEIG